MSPLIPLLSSNIIISMKSELQLCQEVVSKTTQTFEAHRRNKFPNSDQQLSTVVASFSLHNKETSLLEVISIGFGTKSLPYSLAKQHRHKVIKDMHAEILAQRGFCKFLIDSLPEGQTENEYFEWVPQKGKHQLRSNYHLILYSSQNFCGDCMVDEDKDMFSGARPLKYFNKENVPQEKFTTCCLRTKPGRLDLPLSKRSLSLSCSDKIGLWNILGVQGKRLFTRLIPIYINDIILEVREGQQRSRIEKGINLLERICELRGMQMETVFRKTFKIVINKKERYITNQFKDCAPHLHLMQKLPNQQQKGERKLDVCGIIVGKQASWLNGRTGLPEGVNIAKGKPKLSPFCSELLYGPWVRDQEKQFKYTAVKDRLKLLFQEWTTDYK